MADGEGGGIWKKAPNLARGGLFGFCFLKAEGVFDP